MVQNVNCHLTGPAWRFSVIIELEIRIVSEAKILLASDHAAFGGAEDHRIRQQYYEEKTNHILR